MYQFPATALSLLRRPCNCSKQNTRKEKEKEGIKSSNRFVNADSCHVCVEEMYVNRHFFGEVDVGQMVSSSLVLQILASQCIMCSTAKELESPMP